MSAEQKCAVCGKRSDLVQESTSYTCTWKCLVQLTRIKLGLEAANSGEDGAT